MSAPRSATLMCTVELREGAKKAMSAYDIPSQAEFVRLAIKLVHEHFANAAADRAAVEPPTKKKKDKKKEKRKQILCYADVANNDQVASYLTGLNRAERQWAFERLFARVRAIFLLLASLKRSQKSSWSCILILCIQLDRRPAGRGHSNEGWRILGIEDRIFLFLLEKRHGWPDYLLCVLFGVSYATAGNYWQEISSVFYDEFVPRLFYLPQVEETDRYIPDDFCRAFPDTKLIGDGVHLHTPTPGQFSLNSLTFCVYKWTTTVQVVICKSLHPSETACSLFCYSAFSFRDISVWTHSWPLATLWREGCGDC